MSKQQDPYIDQLCPECKFGHFQLPDNGQEWHVVCDECQAVQMVYEPMPHQAKFHADSHKYRLFAGG